jgi:hypothetical protein
LKFDNQLLAHVVDPSTAEQYLAAHGWKASRRTDMFSTWTQPDGDQAHLFLPLSRKPHDFTERLYDFIVNLAEAEEREPEVVFTNLRYAGADLIRVRLLGPRIGVGEVPIEEGASLFEGTRKLITAAACATVEARPRYGARKPAAATSYVEKVRLGQTEPGSYVVTVISPLDLPEEEVPLPEEAPAPFERRVTATLVDALTAAKRAALEVRRQKRDIDVFEDVVKRGVSANLCDAIALAAVEDDDAGVQITVDWGAGWKPPEGFTRPKVSFNPLDVRVVGRAAAVLRELGPYEGAEVEGYVRHLDRGTEDWAGTIVIQGTVGREGRVRRERRNVYVKLADHEYRTAITAHETRQPIALSGSLMKKGRHWVLLDPSNVKIRELAR